MALYRRSVHLSQLLSELQYSRKSILLEVLVELLGVQSDRAGASRKSQDRRSGLGAEELGGQGLSGNHEVGK